LDYLLDCNDDNIVGIIETGAGADRSGAAIDRRPSRRNNVIAGTDGLPRYAMTPCL